MKRTDMTWRQSLMKTFYGLIMLPGKLFGSKTAVQLNTADQLPKSSVFALSTTGINGQTLNLSDYQGKYLLLVNTASDCGYTGQYAELETLYQQYKDKLVVIGFPANDFKEQEKGSNASIAAFCQKNYGVSFPLAAKASVVKGAAQQPIYQWLTNPAQNGWCSQAPVWNFSKYLIAPDGKLIGFFAQTVSPLDKQLIQHIQ
ncbi:MAG TPA: glutathione peroxidase [Chitinophagaceae bacterium]|nr:glutathione peroxidase [Chitinophagaceae bacterium]HCT24118.1 glutathione peroxidase [Chitinophagaceae bacterium]